MGCPFPVYQLGIGCIHGLAVFGGIPFRYVAEGIALGTNGSVIFTFFVSALALNYFPYSQIALVIVSRGAPIAQINRFIRRPCS